MNTAEKRAQLQAQDEPWPDCECHGQPMMWQRNPALIDGGYFHCRPTWNAKRRARRQARRDQGLCVYCAGPLATETLCRDCADAHAAHMASPKQKLGHQFAVIRHRSRRRVEQGFRPTGAGLAAFAAWTERTER